MNDSTHLPEHLDALQNLKFSGSLGMDAVTRPLTSVETSEGTSFRVDMPDATSVFTFDLNRWSTLSPTRATLIHVHGDMNIVSRHSGEPGLEANEATATAPAMVMVSLSSCLKVSGIIVLVLVIVGIAANSSATAYVVHPLFLAVMSAAGGFLFLMSFGRPSS